MTSCPADNKTMGNTLDVIKRVLLDSRVIMVAVAVILYLSFVTFIAKYKKKPPRIKQKRIKSITPAPEAAPDETESLPVE